LNGQDTPHGEGHFPLSRVVIKHCLWSSQGIVTYLASCSC
jgi:hypothetical protein